MKTYIEITDSHMGPAELLENYAKSYDFGGNTAKANRFRNFAASAAKFDKLCEAEVAIHPQKDHAGD